MVAEQEALLGCWQLADPTAAVEWFGSIEVAWWVAGGWALDLYLGGRSRPHADLDVGVLRRDVAIVRARLALWEMFEAKGGRLTRLAEGTVPRLDVHSLWCRPAGATRWHFELMLDESIDDAWVYRRERDVRRPLASIVRMSASDVPYLAPEIQLLYKARRVRPRDQLDFEAIAPRLDGAACEWLAAALTRAEPGHPWIVGLRGSGRGVTRALRGVNS